MNKESVSGSYSSYALALLLGVNLLNYIDRQVIYAVFPLIKDDLHISDTKLGFLGSAFMICYMVSAPLLGWTGDRMSRVKLASYGLAFWSLATAGAGLAIGYRSLLVARSVVGVGEASFGTVAPGLLADYFPKAQHGRVLSYLYLAIPVGSALGYLLGGSIGHTMGWHAAFFIVGVPGLLLIVPLHFLRESRRIGTEGTIIKHSMQPQRGYTALFSRSFLTNTMAMAAMTFALGGLAQWVPTFLYRVHHLDVARGNAIFGGVTVLAGISGTLAGGWLGDRFQEKSKKGYLMVSGWGFFIGTPITIYALITSSLSGCMTAVFFAEFFLFLNTGPLNTVIVTITKPTIRAMAFAVNIFFIHALGDAVSPTILGWLSDLWGLRRALLVTPVAIVAAAFLCFLCMRFIEKDTERDEDITVNRPVK
ncbi:MAG TPA: MFS transporter [Nitrospiraceae bacterium]|jgi:MFS family permease|nr:MFS transporter [Nitrospiraceae bacterium]